MMTMPSNSMTAGLRFSGPSVVAQSPMDIENRRRPFSIRKILRTVASETPINRRSTHSSLQSSVGTECTITTSRTSSNLSLEPDSRRESDLSSFGKEEVYAGKAELLAEAANTSQEFPVSSPHIYQHHGRKKAKPWFGQPWEVRLPSLLEQEWSASGGIKERLEVDLQPTRTRLTLTASKRKCPRREREFNAELRMSGFNNSSAPETITLLPRIWVFCGSEWALKIVQKAIKSISWIDGFLNRPVEFCLGGIELCTVETMIPLEQLRKNAASASSLLFNGGQILYHIAKLHPVFTSPSVCGWLCCATYLVGNEIRSQRLSRVGGVLSSDILGNTREHHLGAVLTVAHGVSTFEESDLEDIEGSNFDDYDDYSDLESDSASSSSENDEDDSKDYGGSASIIAELLGHINTEEVVSEWIPFDDITGTNSFGKIIQNQHPEKDTLATVSDYALLKSDAIRLFHNTYRLSSTSQKVEMVSSYANNHELGDGKVHLILGFDQVEEAWLLPGVSTIFLEGCQVTVRRLQLRAPLAQGTSGTWVVKGGCWYGMVIASYIGEPLAVFITAEDILSDLDLSFPKSSTEVKGQAQPGTLPIQSAAKAGFSTRVADGNIPSLSAPGYNSIPTFPYNMTGNISIPPNPPPTRALPVIPTARASRPWPSTGPTTIPAKKANEIYLKSTAYSFVAPSFRHGRIPFNSSILSIDNNIGWTAHEMAIIMGSDHDSFDLRHDNESKSSRDLTEWFSSFGFNSQGFLIPEGTGTPVGSSNQRLRSPSHSPPTGFAEDAYEDLSDLEEIYDPSEEDITETAPSEPHAIEPYFPGTCEIQEPPSYTGFLLRQPGEDLKLEATQAEDFTDEDMWPDWYNTYDVLESFPEWEQMHQSRPAPPPYTI